MSQTPSNASDNDAGTHVHLDELIDLRHCVGRGFWLPHRSRSPRAGGQLSHRYGRGMDYAESRAYQPGDDVRRLDWRLTARSGSLHTKLFQEEREGRLLIVLDTHASMRFGTRKCFKSVQASRVAALAGWHAVRGGQRVGLMTFGGTQQRLLSPRGGLRGALAVCGAVAKWDSEAFDPRHLTPLSDVLRQLRSCQKSANRVLLVSDGWSCDEAARGQLLDLSRYAMVHAMIVADVLELALPPAGCYPLEYKGQAIKMNLTSQRERYAFHASLSKGATQLQNMVRTLGLPWQVIDTVVEPSHAVATLLRSRRGHQVCR